MVKKSAACGGKARCRSTQMYQKIAVYGRQWPNSLQKYTKSTCTQKSCVRNEVSKLVTEALPQTNAHELTNPWCWRSLSGFIVTKTSFALRCFASYPRPRHRHWEIPSVYWKGGHWHCRSSAAPRSGKFLGICCLQIVFI